MNETEKCPKCGAKPIVKSEYGWVWGCGTRDEEDGLDQSNTCKSGQIATLVTQLAAAVAAKDDAEREIIELRSLQHAVGKTSPSSVPLPVFNAWRDSAGYRTSVLHQQDEKIASCENELSVLKRDIKSSEAANAKLTEELAAAKEEAKVLLVPDAEGWWWEWDSGIKAWMMQYAYYPLDDRGLVVDRQRIQVPCASGRWVHCQPPALSTKPASEGG